MSLSDFEFEVMQLFWEMKEATAPQIHKIIEQRRDVKYSTVKTIIDRLERNLLSAINVKEEPFFIRH